MQTKQKVPNFKSGTVTWRNMEVGELCQEREISSKQGKDAQCDCIISLRPDVSLHLGLQASRLSLFLTTYATQLIITSGCDLSILYFFTVDDISKGERCLSTSKLLSPCCRWGKSHNSIVPCFCLIHQKKRVYDCYVLIKRTLKRKVGYE